MTETGWLIEQRFASHHAWWAGRNRAYGDIWTTDPNAAVRFAREVDAQRALECLAESGLDVHATEHMWVAP